MNNPPPIRFPSHLCPSRRKAGETLRSEVCDCPCQGRGGVQRFRPLQADTQVPGVIAERDVNVVQDLDVIAKEADGLEKQGLDAFSGDGVERLLDRGPDPGASAGALTL